MSANRNGLNELDRLVATEVRAEIARDPKTSVKRIAENLDIRRATLSVRVNGHVPFSPSLLCSVAEQLGLTASEIIARAESELFRSRATGSHSEAVAA